MLKVLIFFGCPCIFVESFSMLFSTCYSNYVIYLFFNIFWVYCYKPSFIHYESFWMCIMLLKLWMN